MSSVDWQKELQAFEAWATAMHFSIGAYVPQGDCFAAKFLADETQGAWRAWKFRVLEQLMAYDYAVNIATNLHRKHFPKQADWEPLPDTLGVLTQIDNMASAWEAAALITVAPELLDIAETIALDPTSPNQWLYELREVIAKSTTGRTHDPHKPTPTRQDTRRTQGPVRQDGLVRR